MARMHWIGVTVVFEGKAQGLAVASDKGGKPGFLKTQDSNAVSPALFLTVTVGS